MPHPAELHLAAIQRQYDEAVARLDQLSDLWGPRTPRPLDDQAAPDPRNPDAVTVALAVGRERQTAKSLTPHSAVTACPRNSAPAACPEHGGEADDVQTDDVEANFVAENFVVQPPDDRITVWGFALPNKRRRTRRPAR